jgi:hypothetical protein
MVILVLVSAGETSIVLCGRAVEEGLGCILRTGLPFLATVCC